MSSKRPTQDRSTQQIDNQPKIDNLIQNGDFLDEAKHWVVDESGAAENCLITPGSAQLKNDANVAQSVAIQRAAAYTLRFGAAGDGVAEIYEQESVSQTIYFTGAGPAIRHFVTRENTTTAKVKITGTTGQYATISNIMLTKDVLDPAELVRNGEFAFGREDWIVRGQPIFQAGLCEMIAPDNDVQQEISGLVVGATYRITCTTAANPSFFVGTVYIWPGEGSRHEIINLNRDTREYVYEHQATSEALRLEFDGLNATYDSFSIKRISVAK